VVRLEKLSAEKIQLKKRTAWKAGCTSSLPTWPRRTECANAAGSVEERQKRLRELQGELERAARAQDQAWSSSRQTLASERARTTASRPRSFASARWLVLKQSQMCSLAADKIRVPDQFVTAIETPGITCNCVDRAAGVSASDLADSAPNEPAGSIAPLAFVWTAKLIWLPQLGSTRGPRSLRQWN